MIIECGSMSSEHLTYMVCFCYSQLSFIYWILNDMIVIISKEWTRPEGFKQNRIYVFLCVSFIYLFFPPVEKSLTADGDVLLCNWDFKSTCSARVTFQRLSPPAWQQIMTANKAVFKESFRNLHSPYDEAGLWFKNNSQQLLWLRQNL